MSPLFILFIIVPIIAILLLVLNLLFAVHNPETEKNSSFECGFSALHGQTRYPFSIQFYLVAILFLVFDLELLVVYPISVSLWQSGSYGFWIVMIFFSILTIGFVYEISTGILKSFVPVPTSKD